MSQQKTGGRSQPSFGKLTEEQLKIIDDVPSSAVELQVKDKVSALLEICVVLQILRIGYFYLIHLFFFSSS